MLTMLVTCKPASHASPSIQHIPNAGDQCWILFGIFKSVHVFLLHGPHSLCLENDSLVSAFRNELAALDEGAARPDGWGQSVRVWLIYTFLVF